MVMDTAAAVGVGVAAAGVVNQYRLEVLAAGQAQRTARDFEIVKPASAVLERGSYTVPIPSGGGSVDVNLKYGP